MTKSAKMDLIEECITQALQLYITAKPYLNSFQNSLLTLQNQIEPLLVPHLNTLTQWAYTLPSIMTVCLFVLSLFIILQIFNFIRRIIAFWLRLAMKISVWALIMIIVSLVWQRGLERSLGELGDWGREIVNVYWREYERWEGYGSQRLQGANYGPRFSNTKVKHGWR